MIIQGALKFLENTLPFHFLDQGELMNVANLLTTEFHPKDSVILRQDGPPSDALRLIKSGSVKVTIESEQNTEGILDIKGVGDNFGFLSMAGGEQQKTNVVALEDTHCYVLKKEHVFRLLKSNPAIADYFLAYLSKYVAQAFEEIRHRSLFNEGSERNLFTTPVGEVAVEVVSAPGELTIREAAQMMAGRKISSLIIQNQDRQPMGIVTDRDLREKVIAQGRSVTDPVSTIATISLITIDTNESCFEAVLRMVQNNIHRLLVVDKGVVTGIVTNHDLMLIQGTSPLSFAKDILDQHTFEGLIPLSKRANNVLAILLKEDARLEQITKIITEINDRLIRKVLEIAEKECGPAPLPYCFVTYGSSGRKEQTFKTDQDNAIIYTDPSSEAEVLAAQSYFENFASLVTQNLARVGFPLCPANYMASNPEWCQPVQVWKKYYRQWMAEPHPEALLKFLILFDMRALWGKSELLEGLKDYIFSSLKDQRLFWGHMANMMLKTSPPIGLFKQFVVEKSGDHKDQFDLKVKGITPLMDVVRLFAMERGSKETSTLERIRDLKDKSSVVQDYADEMEYAFEYVMLLRVRHQYAQIKAGKAPDNFINPYHLTNMEKKRLKDAFGLMVKLQNIVMERYKQMIL
jgi:CBS domain-containing protein